MLRRKKVRPPEVLVRVKVRSRAVFPLQDSKLDGKELITLPKKTITMNELEFSPEEREICACSASMSGSIGRTDRDAFHRRDGRDQGTAEVQYVISTAMSVSTPAAYAANLSRQVPQGRNGNAQLLSRTTSSPSGGLARSRLMRILAPRSSSSSFVSVSFACTPP